MDERKILNEDGEAILFEYERLVWTEAERDLWFKLSREEPLSLGGILVPPSDPLMAIELEPAMGKQLEEQLPYDGVLTFWIYKFPVGLSGLVSIHVLVNDKELRPPITGDDEERVVKEFHQFKKGDVLKVKVSNYEIQYAHRLAVRFYSKPDDPKFNFVNPIKRAEKNDL